MHPTPVATLRPMPRADVHGPGRDRSFSLPQYYATVDGLRCALAEQGDGPVLLFIHGLAANLTHWLHVAPDFVGRCRVVCVDLPGCGNSEFMPAPSVARFGVYLRGLLDLLGVQRATVVGHSLGGMVATAFALAHPERCDGLVLVNPAGFQRMGLGIRLGSRALFREPLLNQVLPRVWRQLLGLVFRTRNRYTEQFIRSVDETFDPDDIIGISRIMCALRPDFIDSDHLDQLSALTLPVQLIWGSDDLLVPARSLRRIAARLPRAESLEIEGCGHMPLIETPRRVVERIERILDGLS